MEMMGLGSDNKEGWGEESLLRRSHGGVAEAEQEGWMTTCFPCSGYCLHWTLRSTAAWCNHQITLKYRGIHSLGGVAESLRHGH